MSRAWLDSLSEDWLSQPGSDASQGPPPTFSSSRAKSSQGKVGRDNFSRIPRLNAGITPVAKKFGYGVRDGAASVLGERSLSEINMRTSHRGTSKASQGVLSSQRGRHLNRSVSASTDGSVIHNTVEKNKSHGASPSKGHQNEPEWRRRLLGGDINYGESKDLFSSAATGLENMFRPPVEQPDSRRVDESYHEGNTMQETTLPSSPPLYAKRRQYYEQEDETLDQSANESSIQQAAPAARNINYQRTEDDTQDLSRDQDSTIERSCEEDSGMSGVNDSSIVSGSVRHHSDASRKTSGQSDLRNEELTPFMVSVHHVDDGKTEFAPMDLPAQQLRQRLETLRKNQLLLDSDQSCGTEGGTVAQDNGTENFETTEDYAKQGGFLNLRRGGRSAEGSFRQRPLSPPLHTDTSEMLPESSLQASTPKQFPTMRTDRAASMDEKTYLTPSLSPVIPRVPYPSPEKGSGSPLKLFGPYDTFTNQTLLRRISQFEDHLDDNTADFTQVDEVVTPTPGSPSKSEINKGFVVGSAPPQPARASHGHHETFGAVNKFGAGDLEGYQFSEEISLSSSDKSQLEDKENMTPMENKTPPSHSFKFTIHEDLSKDESSLLIHRQRPKSSSSASQHLSSLSKSQGSVPTTISEDEEFPKIAKSSTKRDGSEGKRPRTSPSKDPTPKRRRTLHQSDIAFGLEDRPAAIEAVQSSHRDMQSAMGRKRKDARQGDLQRQASPRILAMRQIIRPRSPTPSQRASVMRERPPLADLGLQADDRHDQRASSADEDKIFVQDFAIDGSRKTSMKTQDFFDAAEEIMAMIRNKARPKTELESVEESELESAERSSWETSVANEESFQESTREPFSRPPSRDGRPIPRIPTRQEDAELADRLKQYEECSDLADIITQSVQSMGRMKAAITEVNRVNDSVEQNLRSGKFEQNGHLENEVISDLPNVRFSRNPDSLEHSADAVEFPSNGSKSSGSSTGHSVPTGSSRGSDSRRLIAPEVVSQLIGDQVGNMMFDKEHNIWQKVKTPKPVAPSRNILPSDDSEDDPFASIPDLSVDATKEKENLGLPGGHDSQEADDSQQDHASPRPASIMTSQDAKSILSHTKESLTRIKQTLIDTTIEDDEEVEHEITLHEDRLPKSSPSRRRNLTITFSSPIASIIQDVVRSEIGDSSTNEGDSLPHRSIGNIAGDSLARGRPKQSKKTVSSVVSKSKSRSRSRGVTRTLSVRGQSFVPRPVSRIDEHDEETTGERSVVDDQRQVSVRGESSIIQPETEHDPDDTSKVMVSTPAATRRKPQSTTPTIGQYVGTLSLSPLSEFTMNQGDQSCGLEVSYVVEDRYLVTGDDSKKIMSKAIRSLVEKITEVEPCEPDWDAINELDISEKQLTSLHMLDKFCGGVVTLDASNNSIGHLDGVPGTVRNLRMTGNQLSELTAWGHLMNLQYVDVSDNSITSLYAFKDLVHLRSLRADNNQITSLDGIQLHDSLQVLRVRGNHIEDVDLDGTRLLRLTELDLEGNQISSIRNIDQLPCLTTLNLQNNCLSYFDPSAVQQKSSLRYLKLSRNDITTLDLGAFPSLRLLHVDRNRLVSISGFSCCRRLDSLSLREQRGNEPLDMSFLDTAYEVRKLFLSGNLLSDFEPRKDFLNLQYLELANCGLRSLPAHLGQLMPNLRVVNLNFNAVEDLSGLRYIPRLKKLLVAGNRLADAGRVAEVLSGFPHLSRLDVRDNPATLGFYAPIQTIVSLEKKKIRRSNRNPGDNVNFDGSDPSDPDPFVLPDADAERHEKFTGRLDMGTRMRKRLYDMVVLDRCRRLKVLDGLEVVGGDVATTNWKGDRVWRALVESGVVTAGAGGDGDQQQGGYKEGEESEL